MRPLPDADARPRPPLGDAGPARSATCASTPTTTRSTRAWSGRRVEVRVSQREITAVALDTGELACRHRRVFAGAPHDHRRSSTPRALERLRGERRAATRASRSSCARWRATTR